MLSMQMSTRMVNSAGLRRWKPAFLSISSLDSADSPASNYEKYELSLCTFETARGWFVMITAAGTP